MRRIRIIISVALLLVTLSGCETQKAQNNDRETNNTTATESNATDQENTNTDEKDNTNLVNNTDKAKESNNGQANSQNSASSDDKGQKALYGNWEIKRVAGYGKVSVGEKQELIGLKISLSSNSVTSGNKSFDNPKYEINNRTKDDMATLYKTSFQQIGINADYITEVNILDKNNQQEMTVFIKDNNTLLYFDEGVYYEAIKVS